MSVLRASQLAHSFGDILIFDGLDLQRDRGWTGVVGENGSGKTTPIPAPSCWSRTTTRWRRLART